MMYIVLTAMLALNVAAEVLEAFRVVDSSLTQTIKTVDMKNKQIYGAFEQQFLLNEKKVGEWKAKADSVKAKTDSLSTEIWNLKENLVYFSGGALIGKDGVKLRADDPFFVNELTGDTIRIKKEDDLNSPSEMMVTRKRAEELKEKIIQYKEFLLGMIDEGEVNLRGTIIQELDMSDPPVKAREGGERKSWEVQHFDNKPLIAVLTLLSKIQIDIKNAESHVINYLYSQIDASSFKFNKLRAQVIAESNVIMQGDEFVAHIFLAAEDTTSDPKIYVNGVELSLEGGKGIYRKEAVSPGVFSFEGVIEYQTPDGIKPYKFEHEYQVTEPSYTVAATKMNVLYLGIKNPIDVNAGNIPQENINVDMTNGTIIEENGELFVQPANEDLRGVNTKISLYASVGGTERFMGETVWRVKTVPDPVAQIAGESSGTISRERLAIEQGMEAILEDFDFDFNYTVIQFKMSTVNRQGYTNPFMSNSNRFTAQQREQFPNLISGTYIIFDEIKARGDDGSVRDLDNISFKIE